MLEGSVDSSPAFDPVSLRCMRHYYFESSAVFWLPCPRRHLEMCDACSHMRLVYPFGRSKEHVGWQRLVPRI